MTTTQGRRKHNACLFRLRQNCPFRKLRKNTSDDEHAHPITIGGHWTGFNEQPSVSAAVTNEGPTTVVYKQLSTARSDCGTRRLEVNSDAMDTDSAIQAGPSLGALAADPSAVVVHAAASNSCVRQRNLSEGSSDVSMELDTGVDPETGERAMG